MTHRPRVHVPEEDAPLPKDDNALLQKIFAQLRARVNHDFSGYKRSTVMRRIARRMQLRGIEGLGDYLQLLRRHQTEIDTLFNDLLITVTSFFRDPAVFELLAREVIPQLFEGKGPDDQVRVWVVGCATGEEAYSLAILLLEHSSTLPRPPEVQVFATDVSSVALGRAREGRYPDAIAGDVSDGRLRRFFVQEGSSYRVSKELRERVLFAPHNLLSDPPFSKIDLLTCRNVLIYLKREVQGEVLRVFHYALREDATLLLGTSEAVETPELFSEVDKQGHLFSRRTVAPALHLPNLPYAQPSALSAVLKPPRIPDEAQRGGPGSLHERLLERYAPPSIVVDSGGAIVHLSHHAGRYLRQGGGEPTHDLLKRIRPELRTELRTVLYDAADLGKAATDPADAAGVPIPVGVASARSQPVTLNLEGRPRRVGLRATRAADSEGGGVLIVFDEYDPPVMGGVATPDDRTVRRLEAELETARHRLQVVSEESEGSREEMQASNEELQSINEELRSTAEELETSKEELQSINEELITLNQENKHKVDELSQLTSDLQNLFVATDVATLFLDRERRIKRFTPKVEALFNILTSDIGRPLTHLTHKLGRGDFIEDAQNVLRTLVPVEREIQTDGGVWYLLRLHPYRTAEDRIDGVVLTFVDIDRLKRSDEARRRSEERLRLVVDHTEGYAIFMLDTEGRVVTWNRGAKKVFGYAEAEIKGEPSSVLFTPEDREAGIPERELSEAARDGSAPDDRWHLRRDGARFWVDGVTSALRSSEGTLYGFSKIGRDDTERRAAEEARERLLEQLSGFNETLEQRVAARTTELESVNTQLRRSQQRFTQAFRLGPVAACITAAADGRVLEVNDLFTELTGYSQAEAGGKTHAELGLWASPADAAKLGAAGAADGGFRNLELHLHTKTGEQRAIMLSGEMIELEDQRGFLKMFYDISERKRTEEQMFQAIHEVMSDTTWFSHKILEQLAHLKSGSVDAPTLTELSRREQQVLEQLARGRNNDAIAAELGLATQTVRNYISAIYDKIGVHSRAEAVIWARERGLVGF